jgi:hypothetical protein
MTSNLTELEDWREWKEKCAFSLCGDEAKKRLGKFGSLRLKLYLENPQHKSFSPQHGKLLVGQLMKDEAGNVDLESFADKSWQMLDVKIITKKKDNKSLKDWMSENKHKLGDVESIASCVFRDLAREYIRDERGKKGDRDNDSINRSVTENGLTLGEMTESDEPSPDKIVAREEIVKEVRDKSQKFFLELTADRKVAFVASSLGISLEDPRVFELSQKKKSALYENQEMDLKALVEMLRKIDGLENISSLRIVEAAKGLLEDAAKDWGINPENGCSSLI